MAHRESTGIGPFFFNTGARWGGQSMTHPSPFTPGKKPGTHRTGGWLGPRNGLKMCIKSCQWDLIPRPSRPQQEAISTMLFHPPKNGYDLHTQDK